MRLLLYNFIFRHFAFLLLHYWWLPWIRIDFGLGKTAQPQQILATQCRMNASLFFHGRRHLTFCIQLFSDPPDILSLASGGIKVSVSLPHILEHASLQADLAWGFCTVCTTHVHKVWGGVGQNRPGWVRADFTKVVYWKFNLPGFMTLWMLRQMRTFAFPAVPVESACRTLVC